MTGSAVLAAEERDWGEIAPKFVAFVSPG